MCRLIRVLCQSCIDASADHWAKQEGCSVRRVFRAVAYNCTHDTQLSHLAVVPTVTTTLSSRRGTHAVPRGYRAHCH